MSEKVSLGKLGGRILGYDVKSNAILREEVYSSDSLVKNLKSDLMID